MPISLRYSTLYREITNIFLPGWILKAITKALLVASRSELGSHDRGLTHIRVNHGHGDHQCQPARGGECLYLLRIL